MILPSIPSCWSSPAKVSVPNMGCESGELCYALNPLAKDQSHMDLELDICGICKLRGEAGVQPACIPRDDGM